MKKTSVVVLGGGFTGLYGVMYLDKTLARRADDGVGLGVVSFEPWFRKRRQNNLQATPNFQSLHFRPECRRIPPGF